MIAPKIIDTHTDLCDPVFDNDRPGVIQRAREAGFFFSIPPSVIRSRQKQKLVKRLPLSRLLIETDSPVLGPSPKERNEPATAVIAVEAIAEIKGVPRTEVLQTAYQNTRRLYGDLIT